jgi:hypothetical protein
MVLVERQECVHKRERGALRAFAGGGGGYSAAGGCDEERYESRILCILCVRAWGLILMLGKQKRRRRVGREGSGGG